MDIFLYQYPPSKCYLQLHATNSTLDRYSSSWLSSYTIRKPHSYAQLHVTRGQKMNDTELAQACREVVTHFEGDVGVTLFEYYDVINRQFFNGVLPQAFIITGITPYGRCDGLTKYYSKQPIILVHPILKTEQSRFYLLLHESIHVYVRYCLKYTGKKSHDSEEWLGTVNRIAWMLGYQDVNLAAKKVKRLPKTEGGKTVRVTQEDALPYECSFRFPDALAKHTGIPLPPYETWLA